ncbi:indolepyruvate oxidoreductase subunit beta [Thermoproteus uzoniensis]|nr:indolepyruvate oxidoreductase subunit beta [Thermoproteus uzoniensis]
MVTSVVIVGVGGQGVMTLARWLGRAAMAAGYDVKIAEVHGLSQRGGSVEVHVRLGDRVYGPVVSEGDADYVVAMEALEALRAFRYIGGNTVLVVNKRVIQIPGRYLDPEQVYKALQTYKNLRLVPAFDIAMKIGDPIYENSVLLGYLAKLLGVDERVDWLDERNRRAFDEGRRLASGDLQPSASSMAS